MPVYGYECVACGGVFDETLPAEYSGMAASCPYCGSPSRRHYTPPAVHFHPTRTDTPQGIDS